MSMSCKKDVLRLAEILRRSFRETTPVEPHRTVKRERFMNSTSYRGGFWPTQQQELLLRAALLQGNEATDAWYEWKSSVDVDRLDPGSLRLLPLLYWNLRTHGVKDSLTNRFKGVYRLTWYENQMLFHNMATLLRSFHNAGIQTMILKGAALTLLHYRDYGLRPLGDFDVLVHTEQASAAINLLSRLGWTPELRPLEAFTETYISVTKAYHFADPAGRVLDLHWHLLPECCYANADDDFWDGAILTKIHDVPTHALNPSDQLLHACVHGARWNPVPPFRWVADAMMIMNTSQPEIDWNRLIAHAQKRRLILPLGDTLSYLRDVLDAPIPPAVLQSLWNMPTSKIERIEYEARTRPSELVGPMRGLWFHYLRYSRLVSDGSLQHKLVGFPIVLQHIWGADHLWQVPFYAIFKGMRRIWKMTVWYRNRLARMLP